MSFWESLWLGVVQGLTEFFPVSSSGHLVLFQTILGIDSEGGLLFEVALHVATLGAIVLFYRRRIFDLLRGAVRREPGALRYGGKLAVGTLPAVAVGLAAKNFIETQFSSPLVVGTLLLVTSGIVWSTRFTRERGHADEPSWGAAFAIGCAQACAILPGISRSGATVAAALALGVAPARAAEFSFLLGIIAITGAAVLVLPDIVGAPAEVFPAIWTGGLAAFAAGVFAIWFFVRMLESGSFHYFALWAGASGALFLGWQLLC